MCLIVKIAANCPLPTAPVDPELRRVAVLDLNNWAGDPSYTRWMTLPYVYEVTSRYGCGCARQQIVDVIKVGLQAGPVELFAATDSDLPTVEVTSRREVTLAEIRRFDFQLVERQMVVIKSAWPYTRTAT